MAAVVGRVHDMDDQGSVSTGNNNNNSNRVQPNSSPPPTSMSEQLVANGDDRKQKISLGLRERLGLDEFLALNTWRASVGELLGTGALVFMLDAIVISTYETPIKMPNLLVAVLAAIVITILLLAVSPISGGHLNPIVSLSAGLVGVISLTRAVIYVTAQCIGAVLGAVALKAVVIANLERNFSLGGCTITVITPSPEGPITTGIDAVQAFWLEVICSFIFLFASIWMACDPRQVKSLGRVVVLSIVGIVLGLLVFISTTVTTKKGYAGAGMNPARCLGTAIVRGGHLWDGHWIFWAGPGVACVLFYLYVKIIPGEHFHSDEGYNKHDFFSIVKVSLLPILRETKKIKKKEIEIPA